MWFIPFSFRDLIDIILVAVLMYWVYRATRGSSAPLLFAGIVTIYLLWIVVRAFNMELLSIIFGQIISIGAVAMIILFQPELRRLFQSVNLRHVRLGFLSRLFDDEAEAANKAILPIIDTSAKLSRQHRGAIIVIAQSSDLSLITQGGVEIDAKLSGALLMSIFEEKSPLNEGAIVVSNGRIVAAKCILPVTQSDVSMSMGTRNRAAMGLSEISDAIIITVSSHTGMISLARAGILSTDLSASDLASELVVCFGKDSKTDVNEEVVQ